MDKLHAEVAGVIQIEVLTAEKNLPAEPIDGAAKLIVTSKQNTS